MILTYIHDSAVLILEDTDFPTLTVPTTLTKSKVMEFTKGNKVRTIIMGEQFRDYNLTKLIVETVSMEDRLPQIIYIN
jgi:hypothetical protein